MAARVTRKNPKAGSVPLVAIPGGPGLSSMSLEGLGAAGADVVFVDPPGTGGLPGEPSYTFEGSVLAIEEAIRSLGGPLDLLGHSFGGTYACRLVARAKVPIRSLLLLASPVSGGAFQAVGARLTSLPPEIAAKAAQFNGAPTDAHFREWLLALCDLYFSAGRRARGRELLARDRVSAQAFLQIYPDYLGQAATLSLELAVKARQIPTLLIAGEEDGLIPVEVLRAEAARLGAEFDVLKGAGHFPALDQPAALAARIAEFRAPFTA